MCEVPRFPIIEANYIIGDQFVQSVPYIPYDNNTKYLLTAVNEKFMPVELFKQQLKVHQNKKISVSVQNGTLHPFWQFYLSCVKLTFRKNESLSSTCSHQISHVLFRCATCTQLHGCVYCHDEKLHCQNFVCREVLCSSCTCELDYDNRCKNCGKQYFIDSAIGIAADNPLECQDESVVQDCCCFCQGEQQRFFQSSRRFNCGHWAHFHCVGVMQSKQGAVFSDFIECPACRREVSMRAASLDNRQDLWVAIARSEENSISESGQKGNFLLDEESIGFLNAHFERMFGEEIANIAAKKGKSATVVWKIAIGVEFYQINIFRSLVWIYNTDQIFSSLKKFSKTVGKYAEYFHRFSYDQQVQKVFGIKEELK